MPVIQNNVLNDKFISCPRISNKSDAMSVSNACEIEICFDSPVVPDEHTIAAMWLSVSMIVGL